VTFRRLEVTASGDYILPVVRTQIRFTTEQNRRLKAVARQQGVSMAEVIRRCVDETLVQPDRRRVRFERALAVAGRFREKEGRRDVAARHDDYLKGGWG